MTPALLSLAEGGGTKQRELVQIFQAQTINRVLGGAVMLPWDVPDLSWEWIEVMMAIENGLPQLKSGKKAVESALDKWRKRSGYKQ